MAINHVWRNLQTNKQYIAKNTAIKGTFLFLCCNISPATFIIEFRYDPQSNFQN